MTQDIYFICPHCTHRWRGAMLEPGDDVTVQALATQPYCPQCSAAPPMQVEAVEREEEPA